MRAAYYETNGAARDVLRVDEVETPRPGRGEVRVRLAVSGVNPSDVKSRAGLTRKIAFARVIPHSDGAGEIDQVGEGVSPARVGERDWVWNGKWRRPFGTAAQSIVLPSEQAVALPANTGMDAGAWLGIPAYTAYQAVLLTGVAEGSIVLVAAGAGAVGHYAIQFAKKRKATVITTVSSPAKGEIARRAGRRPCGRLQARGRGRAHHGGHRKARRRCSNRGRSCRQRAALAQRTRAERRGGDLRQRRARGVDSIPVPASEQHHAEVFPGVLDAAGAACARDRRHHAHARARRISPQRGAELRSRRHRGGA